MSKDADKIDKIVKSLITVVGASQVEGNDFVAECSCEYCRKCRDKMRMKFKRIIKRALKGTKS